MAIPKVLPSQETRFRSYRFHNFAAFSGDHLPTTYVSADLARKIAARLIEIAESIETGTMAESAVGTTTLEDRGEISGYCVSCPAGYIVHSGLSLEDAKEARAELQTELEETDGAEPCGTYALGVEYQDGSTEY